MPKRKCPYRAVFLDLFDTLVDLDHSALPLVPWDDTLIPSTCPASFEAFARYFPRISFEDYFRAFQQSVLEVRKNRQNGREVSSAQRFDTILGLLKVQPSVQAQEAAQQALLAHMGKFSETMDCPSDRAEILKSLRKYYRLALISNFDHTPTASSALRRFGLDCFFEAVVISEAVGWRKPAAEIFTLALEKMELRANEVIFVGDTYEVDVVGAKNIKMDVIWVNRGTFVPVDDAPKPDYVIRHLHEILEIL